MKLQVLKKKTNDLFISYIYLFIAFQLIFKIKISFVPSNLVSQTCWVNDDINF